MRFLTFALLILLVSCQQKSEKEIQAEKNLALTTRFFTEVYGTNNLAPLQELFASDYQHIDTEDVEMTGMRAIELPCMTIFNALPNCKVEIMSAAADDEKAIFQIRLVSDLPKMANPETFVDQINFPESWTFWVKDGKIVKGQQISSYLNLVKQLSGYDGGIIKINSILKKYYEEQKAGNK
ncbi:MAG: nuclear transport factor 2 family protein [Saprospiraceae bacterium]|nr:nuclear transport factor 2 family protein [Saprospiraceae bacterium]